MRHRTTDPADDRQNLGEGIASASTADIGALTACIADAPDLTGGDLMVQLNPIEQRIATTLDTFGVPANTVNRDGVDLAPWGDGYMLRWQGNAYLTKAQAVALISDHAGDSTCTVCFPTTPTDNARIIYCQPTEEPT